MHDTHFVVAHLHYVLIGGLMFPMFAGLYYWLPLASGRTPSESISRTAFWMVFIGFHLTFLPMHLTGLLGMTRRSYSYPEQLGVEWLNLLSTAAGFVLAAGTVAILIDAALCFAHGRRARANPWRAGTLEWALRHPVPTYNFASVPVVEDRYPLWHDRGLAGRSAAPDGLLGDPAAGRRELLGTSILGAVPEQVVRLSGSSWQPLLAALTIAALLACFIAKVYLGSALLLVVLVAQLLVWAWTTGDRAALPTVVAAPGLELPVQYACRNAPGWWALVASLLIDGSLFASLVFAYFYLWLGTDAWPPGGMHAGAGPAAWTALVLLAVCWAAAVAAAPMLRRAGGRALAWPMGLAALAGAAFLWLQWRAVAAGTGAPGEHAYASVVWTLAGFHAVHVVVAIIVGLYVAARGWRGYVGVERPLEQRIAAALWTYVAAQGTVAWGVIHLFPEWA